MLSNAAKFTPERGRITLKIDLGEGDCVIGFTVSDTGIGITEEQQSRLFTSFQQADSSTSRNFRGTGLGLALSKRIVKLMGGDISVTSTPGECSTFAFLAKFRKLDENALDEIRGDDEGEMCGGELEGRVVLLAEDIEINREIVMAICHSYIVWGE